MAVGSGLDLFTGAYLHQDWDYEFDSPWGAVQGFAATASAEDLRSGAEQLNELLASSADEVALHKAIDEGAPAWNYPRNELSVLPAFCRGAARMWSATADSRGGAYYELFLLLGVYLWEDIDTPYDDKCGAALRMLSDNEPADAREAAQEIERLFATTSSETERWAVMADLRIGWVDEEPGALDRLLHFMLDLYGAIEHGTPLPESPQP